MSNTQSDLVNMDTMSQLLLLDESGSDAFMTSMITAGFQQVQDSIPILQEYATTLNIDDYKKLGHYLKGALLTLGLIGMASTCERIQRIETEHANQESLLALIKELEVKRDRTKDYLINNLKMNITN